MTGTEHERDHHAVVVVDDEGSYLGDWRSFDVEEVRQVIILVSTCLRWFENHLYLYLISLFARPALRLPEIKQGLEKLFSMSLKDCDPAKEFSFKARKEVSLFLSHVLEFKEGLSISFEQLGERLSGFANVPFMGVEDLFSSIAALFGPDGILIENRPKIFSFLEVVVRNLHESILKTRTRLERLDIALKTKTEVFGHHPTFITTRSDVEEIRQKMGSYVSLTVADSDEGKMFPVGVIHAQDLRKPILGTVSLRDFCNRDEMTIPAYLDVISVIDHHKSHLQTFSPPFALISDAQSSNTLVAKQAFEINDQYSLGGQTLEMIEAQIKMLSLGNSPEASRLLQRLLKKRNLATKKTPFFIDVEREYTEYLHFLYGILDDTDLLSKVSVSDVECVVSLLNRMKSLAEKSEKEVISLEDLPKDALFPKKGAKRILQNEETYSLYNRVYAHREKEMADHIVLASTGKPSSFFADTKVQNGCCRVGQTKLFARNIPLFKTSSSLIQRYFLQESSRINQEKPEIDLFLHLVSTIVSADEVYRGSSEQHSHQDEMWIWIPSQEVAVEHLKRFLTSFQSSAGLQNNPMEAEFVGPQAQEYKAIFEESFISIPSKIVKGDFSFAILRYRAGSLNSRKAMIAPFLPTLA